MQGSEAVVVLSGVLAVIALASIALAIVLRVKHVIGTAQMVAFIVVSLVSLNGGGYAINVGAPIVLTIEARLVARTGWLPSKVAAHPGLTEQDSRQFVDPLLP